MSHLAFFGEPRVPRLVVLLDEIRRGEIRVPRFQRPFVWTDLQRLALVESIYSGFPIGAILVWRTQQHRLATYDHLGTLRLPSDAGPSSVRQYLIDGHQRLATLYAALGPGLLRDETSNHDSQDPAGVDEDAVQWPIYFDLEASQQAANPFRLAKQRKAPPITCLPLDILFDSYQLREFEERLKQAGCDRKTINRVQSIADRFRDYQIPVIPIATEDLDQVTVSFKRVNSGGTEMSEVHMVNALLWRPDFDLLERLESLAERLEPVGWQHFEPQMILNLCKVRVGLPLYQDETEAFASKLKEKPDLLDAVHTDIIHCAAVLDSIGVRGPESLPYAYQAVLLADALHDIAGPCADRERVARLRQWFWITTLTEYFYGMTAALFERTRVHLHAVVHGAAAPSPPGLSSEMIEPIRRFDKRSARSRGLALLLAEQQPIDPCRGSIDAHRLLAEHGPDALHRLVDGRDRSREERNAPENYFLVQPRSAFALREALTSPALRLDRDEVQLYRSHLVNEAARKALIAGQWDTFFNERRSALEQLEEARAKECGLTYRRLAPADVEKQP